MKILNKIKKIIRKYSFQILMILISIIVLHKWSIERSEKLNAEFLAKEKFKAPEFRNGPTLIIAEKGKRKYRKK